MRKPFFLMVSLIVFQRAHAQSNTENLIAGSRAIIELITMLSRGKTLGTLTAAPAAMRDSCREKNRADLCFRNSTKTDLSISIFRRNDSAYDARPFTLKVIVKKRECLLELRSGIYKYRIEAEEDRALKVLSEGEFRLQPCDNMLREIKE